MLTRRDLLKAGTGLVAMAVLSGTTFAAIAEAASRNKLVYSDAEWRQKLSPEQYQVLRHEATERPFTSALLGEHRKGTFICAGCDLPLFAASTKYDSGTGWPSFWQPLTDAVSTKVDPSFGIERTAVECHRCDGHLGHVFNDGPQPTGLRYCINGVALKFNANSA